MNKVQLIESMAQKSDLSKVEAKNALDAFIETTTEALKNGDRIALIGFGSFSISGRPARIGRNPQTGDPITIAAKNRVKFKAGSDLSGQIQ